MGDWSPLSEIMKLLMLCGLLTLTGCANQAKLIQALSKDNATVDLKVTTIYGSLDFHRSMPLTNSPAK